MRIRHIRNPIAPVFRCPDRKSDPVRFTALQLRFNRDGPPVDYPDRLAPDHVVDRKGGRLQAAGDIRRRARHFQAGDAGQYLYAAYVMIVENEFVAGQAGS